MEAESTLTVNVGSFGLNEHIKTQPYWIYLYQYVKIINCKRILTDEAIKE